MLFSYVGRLQLTPCPKGLNGLRRMYTGSACTFKMWGKILLQRNYNIKEKLIQQWATLRFLRAHDMLGQLPDSCGNPFSDK